MLSFPLLNSGSIYNVTQAVVATDVNDMVEMLQLEVKDEYWLLS